MKINAIKLKDNVVYKINTIVQNDKVKEIKYFESSQVYNKFLHEAFYVIEFENSTIKTIIPVRSVLSIEIETKKEEAIMHILENLGD